MALAQSGRWLRHLARSHAAQKTCNGYDSITNPLLYAGQGLRYRKLEVILTTSIEKLGKAGETVKVAPGHFRNHLMPKLLAVPNIEKYAFLIREQRKIYQREEEVVVTEIPKTKEDKMKEYEAAAKRLDNGRIRLNVSFYRCKFFSLRLNKCLNSPGSIDYAGGAFPVETSTRNCNLPSSTSTLGESLMFPGCRAVRRGDPTPVGEGPRLDFLEGEKSERNDLMSLSLRLKNVSMPFLWHE
ncbi:unnamed protein product [Spirodela intermedia]|uniref:Large ribosomal subunit protein bL9c n=1 Tax=Spirodela intermedia TaxID=51605 RepID=A0A7I8IUK1_SPIIN|nr:unnamed protein product [Spirodela intermedia]CAA6661676.1 unnamed protein product [Spirodela intermedia]